MDVTFEGVTRVRGCVVAGGAESLSAILIVAVRAAPRMYEVCALSDRMTVSVPS
jgi:hypothetical protein